jgi:endonuclease-3
MKADAKSKQALQVHQLLLEEYGHRAWRRRRAPLDELIFTILSQNTSDVNRDRAQQQLRERYPTWEEVLEAPEAEIVEAIEIAGLGNIRAARIKAVLARIVQERGSLELDFLAEMDDEGALAWLEALPGVGPKTAACVFLFSLGRPVLPVDTHVHRVAMRVGLIEEGTSREKAHRVLAELVPPEAVYDFHLNMIAHGRRVCQARRPRHEGCVLAHLCCYYQALLEDGTDSEM